MLSARAETTRLLNTADAGDPAAFNDLVATLYHEVRVLAQFHLKRERANHTLQPTALVNEVYLKLVDQGAASTRGRAYFLGAVSVAIRRVLVDHARGKRRLKRRAGLASFDEATAEHAVTDADAAAVLDLDQAISELAARDERKARVIELRFFGGLSAEEAAQVLGVSKRTVDSEWAFARAWLGSRLSAWKPEEGEESPEESGSAV